MIVRLRARLSVFENRYEMSSSRVALADARWRGRLKEIARAREIVCDFLVGDNEYVSTASRSTAASCPSRWRPAGTDNPHLAVRWPEAR
jgi:hypothetical protein